MKTKAEAIANPEKGDVWEKASHGLLYFRLVKKVQAQAEGGEMIYVDGFGQTCATTTRSFRRWAQNATFLGGKG